MSVLARHQFTRGRENNYAIAGNICNAFALGDIGSSQDFFLVGIEPRDESNYPLLTGNILDSEGNVLFRLARNVLVFNPGNCSRIFGDHIGYEICDDHNNVIFRVRTVWEKLPGLDEETFVTTLTANCYDKDGRLVFRANTGGADEQLEGNVKCAFGFAGEFDFVQNMNEQELSLLRSVLGSRGAVHELITGSLDGQEIILDGKALMNAYITNCLVHVKTGEFAALGNVNFDNCRIIFHEAADNIKNLVVALQGQSSGEPGGQHR
jgi:hypothetical protein